MQNQNIIQRVTQTIGSSVLGDRYSVKSQHWVHVDTLRMLAVLENNQGRNWKKKKIELLTHISTNDITKLNEIIHAGVKLFSTKIGVPWKNTNRNSKPRWKIRLEAQIRNLLQQAKTLRQTKNAKSSTIKTNNTTRENKSESAPLITKEGRLKRYRDKIKQYRQNKTFWNCTKNSTSK